MRRLKDCCRGERAIFHFSIFFLEWGRCITGFYFGMDGWRESLMNEHSFLCFHMSFLSSEVKDGLGIHGLRCDWSSIFILGPV